MIGILWIFVVVKMNFICGGGFFSVFKSVLKVLVDSMCILLMI